MCDVAHLGLFYDGEAAHAQSVEVTFEETALVIAHGGRILARWRYAALYLATSGAHPGLRIGARGAGEARLVIEDSAAIAELRRRAPRLFARKSRAALLRRALYFAAASAALLTGAYYSLPYLAEALVPFVPLSVERQIGEQVRAAFETSFGSCASERDKPALAILDRLTKRILGANGVTYEVSVEVSQMKLENAFALPGGMVVVTHELITLMESPDELAGVLGHELGHVVERHAMIGMVESTGLSLVTTLLLGGGSSSGEWFVNAATTLASLSYSRRLEARADERGIAMLEAAGISPAGLGTLFERLERNEAMRKGTAEREAESDDSLSVFLSSHPPSALRIARVQKSALVKAPPALSAEEWAQVKSLCAAEPQEPPAPQSKASPAAPDANARDSDPTR
jgi:predicted Zn-dependent protease